MVDTVSKERRSEIMSLVKGRNTKPELLVRSYLHRSGLRFRVNVSTLPGRPDIVLRKHRAIVFVHGCFWHGHMAKNCKLARTPKSNVAFWTNKVIRNRQRDKHVMDELTQAGWRVFVVWECAIQKNEFIDKLVNAIQSRSKVPKIYKL